MLFEIAAPRRIIFGPGTVKNIGTEASSFGRRPLLVCGRNRERSKKILASIEQVSDQVILFQSQPEPTVELVLEGVQRARESSCDFVIGIGGGSVIDTGKAISGLLANPGDPFDYLEVIGKGRPLIHPAVPYIAIPTTAGTGAEATRNAVLGSPPHRVKVSLRSPQMVPSVALVDPELTYSLPPSLTATTGMDALTQLIEAFVSQKSNPFTDSICREGIRRASRSLQRVYEVGNDTDAREDLAIASLFSGLALANAGLGAVHGLAGPLGGLTEAAHGEICAALLPSVMDANITVLRRKGQTLCRYEELTAILTGGESESPDNSVRWVLALSEFLQIRSLSALGLRREDIPLAAERALDASSMKGNPVDLSRETLVQILRQAF